MNNLTKVFDKLKKYNPKYKKLEIIMHDLKSDKFIPYCLIDYDEAVERYGEFTIETAYDFEDTKTTSLILRTWIKEKTRVIN